MKKLSSNHSLLLVESKTKEPEIFIDFQNITQGFSDIEILKNVIFVHAGDPRIPEENAFLFDKFFSDITKSQDMQFKIALWPDGISCVLGFSKKSYKPNDAQLIRAYGNARHAKLAISSANKTTERSEL